MKQIKINYAKELEISGEMANSSAEQRKNDVYQALCCAKDTCFKIWAVIARASAKGQNRGAGYQTVSVIQVSLRDVVHSKMAKVNSPTYLTSAKKVDL